MRQFIKGPFFTGLVGAFMILSGLCEIVDWAFEPWLVPAIGVEHGVLMWGVGQVLKALVDIVDGMDGLVEG